MLDSLSSWLHQSSGVADVVNHASSSAPQTLFAAIACALLMTIFS